MSGFVVPLGVIHTNDMLWLFIGTLEPINDRVDHFLVMQVNRNCVSFVIQLSYLIYLLQVSVTFFVIKRLLE